MWLQIDADASSLPLWIALGGAAAVWVVAVVWSMRRLKRLRREVQEQAKQEAQRIRREAQVEVKEEQIRARERFEQEHENLRTELERQEERLRRREDDLSKKLELFSKKERFLEKMERSLAAARETIEEDRKRLDEMLQEEKETLRSLAGMTREQAQELLLHRIEKDVEEEAAEVIGRVTRRAEQEAQEKAREILTLAIQRTAATHTSGTVVSTVELPNDDMKGRVIGRDGRNIRAFEKATGVDVIVDDTPGIVLISCFDAVRRETAKRVLEKLLEDGRIHPARIEEAVGEVRKEMDKVILDTGKQAGFEAGVHGLHPKVVPLLGRLNFLTAGGQSVLRHTQEVVQLSATLAGELGLDVQLAKRIALLHDIGRAASHEMEGSHASVGADLARRYDEKPDVVNAIAAHHGEEKGQSLYAVVLQAANDVSNQRPGGAHENMERFLKRMTRLEEIARSHEGVKEAYAIQAGREVRVVVDPDSVPDKFTPKLCRAIAKEIEEKLTYPGEVQVTLLRERRAKGYVRK